MRLLHHTSFHATGRATAYGAFNTVKRKGVLYWWLRHASSCTTPYSCIPTEIGINWYFIDGL